MAGFGLEQEDVKWIFALGFRLVEGITVVASASQVSSDSLRLSPRVDRVAGYAHCKCFDALVASWDL
jgi:hypothetical protein